MKHILWFVFLFTVSSNTYGQLDSLSIDPKYLEDQLYTNISYNTFTDTPAGFLQNGFSFGIGAGFIKDIPFNKQRNVGIGIGFGYAYNTYIHNVAVSEDIGGTRFNVETTYDNNSYRTHSVELPIEFRWRTSTLDKYKFWRIYGGVTLGYIFDFSSKFVSQTGNVAELNVPEIENFQYALSLSAGYGSWNFFVNYALSPFFEKGTILESGEELSMKTLRLGLAFYFF